MLTATVALAMWAFLRVLDEEETRPRLWAFVLAASLGVGLLWKSLVGTVFPVATGILYLAVTRQLFVAKVWRRLHPFSGLLVILAIAAPWHVLAMLRNPPYFDFTMHSAAGEYHGFFWFFFINEQLLRFLNLRYPRDYDTVPRVLFWGLHLLWLFPWSLWLPAVAQLSFRPKDRPGRTRLLALCWIGFILVFFTFSTTQEYYSMPCYPAIALLIGCAMTTESPWLKRGTRVLAAIAIAAAVVVFTLAFLSRNYPAPGDISNALVSRPGTYKLSLDHMKDLTLRAFAYLRTPLIIAGIAFAIGAAGMLRAKGQRAYLAAALMMVLFFHAARVALVTFDPYLGSRPLADALLRAPEGQLIIDHHYYTFSSVFFYTNRTALLLNGRFNNLVYGSYAPGSSGCIYRRRAVPAAVGQRGPLLHRGRRNNQAQVRRTSGERPNTHGNRERRKGPAHESSRLTRFSEIAVSRLSFLVWILADSCSRNRKRPACFQKTKFQQTIFNGISS